MQGPDQPDVCRCCLMATGTWDLNKEYEEPARKLKVLSDLLTECFGFALSRLHVNGYSHFICDQCVEKLRDASAFRNQVVAAELALEEYIDKTTHVERIFTSSEITTAYIKAEPDISQDNNFENFSESVKAEPDVTQDNNFESFSESVELEQDGQGTPCEYVKEEKYCKIMSEEDPNVNSKTNKVKRNKKSCAKTRKSKPKNVKFSNATSEEFKLEPVDSVYLSDDHEGNDEDDCGILRRILRNKSGSNKKSHKEESIRKSSESLEKYKQILQSRILYRCIRENTAVVLKNSTVTPFRNLRCTNGKYTCQYCEVNYLNFDDLRNHVEKDHAQITKSEIISSLKSPIFQLAKAEISVIKCKICADTFENLESLTEHLVNAHSEYYHSIDFKPSHGILGFIVDSGNPKCFLCLKEFPFFQALVKHMSEHGSENFKCDKCGKKFFTPTRLSVHKSRAHDEKPQEFKCKFCDEIFTKISLRQSHMKTRHRYGWLKCGECGESFPGHRQRSRHMVKTHNYKNPTFSCSQCPKVFTSASNLSGHVKTHGDNKIYNCEVCGKKVTSKGSLTIHLRVHTGERPFACQFCEKRFKSYTVLDMHERGHLNDKRYVCEICESAFVQIHSLRRHYKSQHPESGVDLTKIRAKKAD